MGKRLPSLKVMSLFLLTLLTLAACAQSPAEPTDTQTPGGATRTSYPSPTKVAISPPAAATTTSASPATPTPTVCLDKAPPVALPPRKTPLEVQFISDGNIWLWREEGGIAQRITNTGDARSLLLSDDGQVIAFTRGIDKYRAEIWAINRDGSNCRIPDRDISLAKSAIHRLQADEQSGELRLGQIGGPSRTIGPFNGAYATYRYNRDSAAVGQSN